MTELEHIDKCITLLVTAVENLATQAQQTANILKLLIEKMDKLEKENENKGTN